MRKGINILLLSIKTTLEYQNKWIVVYVLNFVLYLFFIYIHGNRQNRRRIFNTSTGICNYCIASKVL